MIQVIEGAPQSVLAFEAVGEVDSGDYKRVLKPAVETKLAGGHELRVVFAIRSAFDRFTAGAEWQDMTLGLGHLGDWQRCAIVTDRDWVRHGVKAFGWMMGGRVRLFDAGELDAALEWAAADD